MKPKWQKLASLAQEICTLWFQLFGAVFASKGYSLKNILGFLKFGINIRYYKLYCVLKNQTLVANQSFICPFFFLSNKTFCQRFLRNYLTYDFGAWYKHQV